VYRRLVVLHLVVDRDAESVSPCCTNGWPRILPVHEEADLVAASTFVACAVGDI
jgi:hypothetical protein